MRFLLDEDVPNEFISILRGVGYVVEHINYKCKGMTDLQVFEYAFKEKLTIITLDADYCILRKRENYGIIKINGKIQNKIEVLLELLQNIKNNDLKDVYYQIDRDKVYREEKVYSKKKHKFKHYRRIPIIIKSLENRSK